jgi:uncharacterized protein
MRCVELKTSSDGVKIFKALDRKQMLDELRSWTAALKATHPRIVKIGLFGSYARGDYRPGSDLDILIIVSEDPESNWFLRGREFDADPLPAGADVLVYTQAEASGMALDNPWMIHILSEIIWIE